MLFIGIDLGTSAVKLLLTDETGRILRTVTRTYPISFPQPGWAEQEPEDWWSAVRTGVPELLRGFDARSVAGIGAGGQMHGLVALDAAGRVLRPAILWNDGRTAEETEYLNETVGREKLLSWTANIAFAGFTAPKLLWMRRHEPERFAALDKIMLPKDYVNYRLTGVHATDYSDASGTLLLDVRNRRWSPEMLALCGLAERCVPRLYESAEVIGTLTPESARALGLPERVRVVAGAGDNAAAALGTGTAGEGGCNLSIGTSGTVFLSSETFRSGGDGALHAFCHADGGYHLMGCMLSAAACNKWFCGEILGTEDYEKEQSEITRADLGQNRVLFLPYLMGERSPINDVRARGTFTGLTLSSTRAELVQAVLEGVAFGIRDSLEAAKALGLTVSRSRLCGGGARSALWRTIFANVLGIPLDEVRTEQGPGYGGAMLAMTGCGVFPSARRAAEALTAVSRTEEPDRALTARYEARYAEFRLLYPAMKRVFAAL